MLDITEGHVGERINKDQDEQFSETHLSYRQRVGAKVHVDSFCRQNTDMLPKSKSLHITEYELLFQRFDAGCIIPIYKTFKGQRFLGFKRQELLQNYSFLGSKKSYHKGYLLLEWCAANNLIIYNTNYKSIFYRNEREFQVDLTSINEPMSSRVTASEILSDMGNPIDHHYILTDSFTKGTRSSPHIPLLGIKDARFLQITFRGYLAVKWAFSQLKGDMYGRPYRLIDGKKNRSIMIPPDPGRLTIFHEFFLADCDFNRSLRESRMNSKDNATDPPSVITEVLQVAKRRKFKKALGSTLFTTKFQLVKYTTIETKVTDHLLVNSNLTSICRMPNVLLNLKGAREF